MLPLLVSLGLSLLLIGLSWVVNEKNASTLMAGYNMMTKAEQAQFPLRNYLRFTRRGMLWISAAYVGTELVLRLFVEEYAFAGVLVLLLGLACFIWLQGRRFDAGKPLKYALSAGLLVVLAVIIAVSGQYMQNNNDLIISAEKIEITGSYGLSFPLAELESWAFSDTLPAIRMRRHGYSDGELLKGIFTTQSREKVRLFVRRSQGPYLYLKLHSGEQIWFGLEGEATGKAFEQLARLKN